MNSLNFYAPVTFSILSGTKYKNLNKAFLTLIFKLFYFATEITCNFIAEQVLSEIQNFIWLIVQI